VGERRDAAARLLTVLLGALPAGRAGWREAMHAELDRIEPAPERLQFALSCGRVALPALGTPLAGLAVTGVALYAAAGIGYPEVRAEMIGLVLLLAALGCAGRWSAAFGPVGAGRAARGARAGGLLALAGVVLIDVFDSREHPGNHSGEAISSILVIVILLGYLMTLLAVTAARSPLSGRAIAAGSLAALGGAAGWTALTLLGPSVGTGLGFPLATAATAALAGAAFTRGSTAPRAVRQWVGAALWAGGGALLLITFCAALIMDLSPRRVPHIVDRVMVAGSTAAQKLAENRIETGDTYFGVLVFGALAVAAVGLLVGAARPLLSVWLMPAVSGVILVAYAMGVATWPESILVGSGGFALITIALALSARGTRQPAR
jgi:hypothetical protein